MPARTTRSTSLKSSTNNTQKATNKASSSKSKKLSPELVFEESDDDQESAVHGDSEEYNGEEDDVESLHSDALDDEDEPVENARKRKRGSHPSAKAKTKSSSSKKSPRKKRKTDEDEDAELDFDLEDGQEVVGAIVRAPTTGRVPPGQISQNTLDFLTQLKNPECNDREWFKLHEPVYRLAEEEWKAFIEEFTDVLAEADPQIPHLPPKDVTHRIYRDVRFSNDKTPYKTGLSASFSRSGRKGIFAGYHVGIRPGGESVIAAGSWCPERNEIATIRNNLQRSSTRLRKIISAPRFVGLFGEAKPHPKGERRNIFGGDDELKVAPKGINKNHKDIDLLKCRSFAVFHRFTDKQVLAPDFKDELGRLVKILRPFVHCINDLMTVQNADSSNEDDADDQDEEILDIPSES